MGAVEILDKDIIQANPLIRARKEMNLTEMRLFALGLQGITPHIKDDHFHDVDFPLTLITHKDLKELFGDGKNNGNVENLRKQIKKAYNAIMELSYTDGGFELRHIYELMRYVPEEGLYIQFGSAIKKYILEILNQPYTKCRLKAFFSLSSTYAWRILESLLEKQGYFKLGNKEIFVPLTVEEIRFRLNVPDGLYAGKMCNFRSRVLDNPIREINEKTDYYVWYDVIKTGRKVTGFKIWMRYKDDVAEKVKSAELPALPALSKNELAKEMLAEGMPEKAINIWVKNYGVDGAAASWRLAVEHADGRTETRHKGVQRYKYIKSCMERNIAQMNKDDARIKAEIDAREKRIAEEKKRHQKEDLKTLGKLGISFERHGSDMQSTGSLLGADADTTENSKNSISPTASLNKLEELKRKRLEIEAKIKVNQEHGQEPQEGKTIEEQLEERGQQRLFEDEEANDDGNIFSDGSKESFKSEFAKIMRLECSNDEKLKKILSIEGDDESGNLLKMMALLIETSGKINEYGHREIKL